jgi:plastocyanin
LRRALLALAAAATALSGCGGGETKPKRTVTVSGGAVEVVADEYSFDPAQLDAAPGKLKITLRNEGSLPHNLRVGKEGTDTFQGGSRTVTLDLEPGRYTFFCSVGYHEQLGMKGVIEVH